MRILSLALIGLAAVSLAACDGDRREHRRHAAADKSDCCCDKTCPTPAPTKAEAGGSAAIETAQVTETVTETAATPPAYRARKAVRRASSYRRESDADGYGRGGTEGVGYLDEGEDASAYRRTDGYAGGYRSGGGYETRGGEGSRRYARADVTIDERESYSERRSSSESGYAYGGSSYESGGYGYEGRGRKGKKRRYHDSYVGTDRYGYLTWPGKTP